MNKNETTNKNTSEKKNTFKMPVIRMAVCSAAAVASIIYGAVFMHNRDAAHCENNSSSIVMTADSEHKTA